MIARVVSQGSLSPAVDAAIAFEHTPVVIPARLSGEVDAGDLLSLMAPEVRSTLGQPLAATVAWLYVGPSKGRPGPDQSDVDQPAHIETAWTYLGEAEPELSEIGVQDLHRYLSENPSQVRPFIIIPWDTHLAQGALTVNGRIVRIQVEPSPGGDLGAVGDWLDYPGSAGGMSRTPFEAFRRTLMYELADLNVEPTVPVSPLICALARLNTQRWLFGIERFSSKPGMVPGTTLGDDLRHILTRQCTDGAVQFAGWLNQPSRMTQLEMLLLTGTVLNPAPDDKELRAAATAIASMLTAEPEMVFWIESDHGQAVRLAGANLSHRIVECNVEWESAAGGGPARIWALRPGKVERIILNRPGALDVDGVGTDRPSGIDVIRITQPGRTFTLVVDPPLVPVTPPGVTITRFVSAWRQPSWLSGRPSIADPDQGTMVTIQLGPDGWELVISADAIIGRLPEAGEQDGVAGAVLRATHTRNTGLPIVGLDPSGVESLSLIVGRIDAPVSVTTIEPFVQGGRCIDWLDSGLDVSSVQIRTEPGHWAARVPIPDSWLNGAQILDIGFVRSHAGRSSVDVFPRPCFPWHLDPGRVRFDLSQWHPMPVATGE